MHISHLLKFVIGVVLIAAASLLAIFSCTKKEDTLTPFYEVIKGNWALDSIYQINGQSFQFDDYDLNGTAVTFNSVAYDYEHSSSLGYAFSGASCAMNIYNESGLVLSPVSSSVTEGQWFSQAANLMRFNTAGGYCHFWRDYTSDPFDHNYIFPKLSHLRYYIVPIEDCDQYYNSDIDKYNDCNSHITGHIQDNEIDHFSLSNGEYFKLDLLSANSIEMRFYIYYYNRVLDGTKLHDEVIIRLKKLNISGTVTIPPFHPDNYALYWWNNCNGATGGITLKGNASIQPNGIDNNCVCTDGFGSYAEYTRKPQVPMTLSFWVKPTTVKRTKQVLYSKYKNKFGPFIMSLEQDKFVLEINDGYGNLQKITAARPVAENEWNHICISVDADNKAVLYINSDADGQGTVNSLTYDATAKILLGTTEEAVDNGTDINLRGCLDEIIFFKKVLSAGEIKQLYLWHLTN